MAGDWLKVQKDTPDKPEVLAIAARMNLDPDAVVGKMIRIWSWFDTHTVDGNASCVTFAFLNRLTGVTGFAENMASVGWLVHNGDVLSLPNFDFHNGDTAKKRAMGKNRIEKHRSNAECNAGSVTKTLPEKRREEKSKIPSIPEDDGFVKFWEAWPKSNRKGSKNECIKSWKKSNAEEVHEKIIAHVESLKSSNAWLKNNGEFIPSPLVYLNQRRWDGADIDFDNNDGILPGSI